MKALLRPAFALAAALALTSCATMVNGRTQQIPVSSDPPQATVTVDCGNAPMYGGVTPVTITVPRAAENCSITLGKEGYRERRVQFERQISRATQANKIPGVAVGVIAATLAWLISPEWLYDDIIVEGVYQGGGTAGAAPGNAVDRRSGAAYKQVPGEIHVVLEPDEAQPPPEETSTGG